MKKLLLFSSFHSFPPFFFLFFPFFFFLAFKKMEEKKFLETNSSAFKWEIEKRGMHLKKWTWWKKQNDISCTGISKLTGTRDCRTNTVINRTTFSFPFFCGRLLFVLSFLLIFFFFSPFNFLAKIIFSLQLFFYNF